MGKEICRGEQSQDGMTDDNPWTQLRLGLRDRTHTGLFRQAVPEERVSGRIALDPVFAFCPSRAILDGTRAVAGSGSRTKRHFLRRRLQYLDHYAGGHMSCSTLLHVGPER